MEYAYRRVRVSLNENNSRDRAILEKIFSVRQGQRRNELLVEALAAGLSIEDVHRLPVERQAEPEETIKEKVEESTIEREFASTIKEAEDKATDEQHLSFDNLNMDNIPIPDMLSSFLESL